MLSDCALEGFEVAIMTHVAIRSNARVLKFGPSPTHLMTTFEQQVFEFGFALDAIGGIDTAEARTDDDGVNVLG